MRIGILQLNFKIGDFEGNLEKIVQGYRDTVASGAELVVASELALFGYPPGDMLLRGEYIDRQDQCIDTLCRQVGTVGLIVGVVSRAKAETGLSLFNSALLIRNRQAVHLQHKMLLPNYDVFDERRYFEAAVQRPQTFRYNGLNLGMLICEDIWSDFETIDGHKRYRDNPVAAFEDQSPDLLVTINASPFYSGKSAIRRDIAGSIAARLKCPLVYVNQVGGNDELVFDGRSFAVSPNGDVIARARGFAEDVTVFDLDRAAGRDRPWPLDIEALHDALVLGTRDYVLKSIGSPTVAIALSGGIDSAVTACIASRAVGPENVLGVGMPSAFSSPASVDDARALAANLGISWEIIPIGDAYHAFEKALQPVIGWGLPGAIAQDVTEENIQARIRGTLMMAISNRRGGIVLSTGNKSELSVGYCTLYGDMAGGFAVLSDVLKTKVYALAEHINRHGEIIPWNTIRKAPSAELRPDQKDSDTLPPYDVLDPILDAYIEKGLGPGDIVQLGYDPQTVRWIIQKVNGNEYKRRQMAPGLKVTQKAFGCGRRMPIAASF